MWSEAEERVVRARKRAAAQVELEERKERRTPLYAVTAHTSVTCTLPVEQFDAFSARAKQENRNRADIMRELIRQYLCES